NSPNESLLLDRDRDEVAGGSGRLVVGRDATGEAKRSPVVAGGAIGEVDRVNSSPVVAPTLPVPPAGAIGRVAPPGPGAAPGPTPGVSLLRRFRRDTVDYLP